MTAGPYLPCPQEVLGPSDPAEARSLLGHEALFGLSVSTPEELVAAQELGAGTIDYLGVGPVWGTASKPDHAIPIGLAGLSQIVADSLGRSWLSAGSAVTESLRSEVVVPKGWR